MQFPTVNLNGTSRNVLIEEYDNALEKLRDALTALSQVTVHGRDYHLNGGDIIAAWNEQRARCNKIVSVIEDLQKVREHLEPQT